MVLCRPIPAPDDLNFRSRSTSISRPDQLPVRSRFHVQINRNFISRSINFMSRSLTAPQAGTSDRERRPSILEFADATDGPRRGKERPRRLAMENGRLRRQQEVRGAACMKRSPLNQYSLKPIPRMRSWNLLHAPRCNWRIRIE